MFALLWLFDYLMCLPVALSQLLAMTYFYHYISQRNANRNCVSSFVAKNSVQSVTNAATRAEDALQTDVKSSVCETTATRWVHCLHERCTLIIIIFIHRQHGSTKKDRTYKTVRHIIMSDCRNVHWQNSHIQTKHVKWYEKESFKFEHYLFTFQFINTLSLKKRADFDDLYLQGTWINFVQCRGRPNQ